MDLTYYIISYNIILFLVNIILLHVEVESVYLIRLFFMPFGRATCVTMIREKRAAYF